MAETLGADTRLTRREGFSFVEAMFIIRRVATSGFEPPSCFPSNAIASKGPSCLPLVSCPNN